MSLLFQTLMRRTTLQKTLARHFNPVEMSQVVTAVRDLPVTARVDVQAALDEWFRSRPEARLLGIHTQMGTRP